MYKAQHNPNLKLFDLHNQINLRIRGNSFLYVYQLLLRLFVRPRLRFRSPQRTVEHLCMFVLVMQTCRLQGQYISFFLCYPLVFPP